MSKAPLPTYLRTHRKRANLFQEEVALLLDAIGATVSRHEANLRAPTLRDAFAYEALFGLPASALFPGEYEKACRLIEERAVILLGKLLRKTEQSAAERQRILFLESVLKRLRR
jgi:DNA-binding XRE family transcriptional regulator